MAARGTPGGTTARRGIARAAAAVLALAACLAASARAADDELVKFLLKQGRAALEKNRPEEAAAKFQKAAEEDRDSVDAWWWLGQALERKGDGAGAVAAYRDCARAQEARRARGAGTAEDAALARKAAARLEVLAAGEGEFHQLQDVFVAQVLTLAKAGLEKDPATARRAVEYALRVAPDEPEAKALAERLGIVGAPGGPSKPPAGAPKGLSSWDDLLERKAFEASTAEYDGDALRHDVARGGEVLWALPQPQLGERFALDVEVRCVEPHKANWFAGWAFYQQGPRFLALILEAGGCALLATDADSSEDLKRGAVAPGGDEAGWRRLTLEVEGGRKLRALVDGKAVFEHVLPDAWDPQGRVGLWTQNCRAEYRRARVGTP